MFTAPDRNNVNGYVTNKLPLSYNGNIIDGFTLTFKDGEIVEVKAEKGEEVLKDLINTDEGSRRLGEVALVPDDSPISNRRTIFTIHYSMKMLLAISLSVLHMVSMLKVVPK